MTFDDVRKIALAWPEVEDGTSYGTPALKVRKKLLARLKEDGDSLVMPGVPRDEREMLVESQPKVFYFTDHYRDYPIALIRLSKANRAIVEPLLRRQQIEKFVHLRTQKRPAHLQMPQQAVRFVLGEDSYAADVRIEAIRQREVDDAELAAEKHGGLGAAVGQLLEPTATAARQHQRERASR